jgi:hypothetical protein
MELRQDIALFLIPKGLKAKLADIASMGLRRVDSLPPRPKTKPKKAAKENLPPPDLRLAVCVPCAKGNPCSLPALLKPGNEKALMATIDEMGDHVRKW